ncbi:phytanoyl-CoA dioxygenase family protein [Sphingomonas oryzagri]
MRLDRAALSCLGDLRMLGDAMPQDQAGVRLHGVDGLARCAAGEGILGCIAAATLGTDSRPVRAILFDKTAGRNWSLGWHQDRTIAVRERIETPGFGPWTIKAGMSHVAPPPAFQAGMLTMRVHLDDVPDDNAPLLVAPGSHRLGRIAEEEVDGVVRRLGVVACTAKAGDVWCNATPILHASAAAARPQRRRVLQIDFAAMDLPGGLEWLGI